MRGRLWERREKEGGGLATCDNAISAEYDLVITSNLMLLRLDYLISHFSFLHPRERRKKIGIVIFNVKKNLTKKKKNFKKKRKRGNFDNFQRILK